MKVILMHISFYHTIPNFTATIQIHDYTDYYIQCSKTILTNVINVPLLKKYDGEEIIK